MNKLLKSFTKLENRILGFIDKYRAKILGLVALGVVVSLGMSFSPAPYNKPELTKEFAETSVMILDKDNRSGGSGVILRSNIAYSTILTNKHVCRLTKGGGYVVKDGRKHLVHSIKRYASHDLCLVKVFHNFGVNTKIADSNPLDFNDAFISGHPGLLPHVLTKGNFSGHEIIKMVVGIKSCDNLSEEELMKYVMYCIFFGGVPVVQDFEAQLVTGTILPGSSGSGVFNTEGEIGGLVFAGRGEGLGYAFIVPHQYLVDFIQNENLYKWQEVNTLNYDNMIRSIFTLQNYCNGLNPKLKTFCDYRKDYLIWRKN